MIYEYYRVSLSIIRVMTTPGTVCLSIYYDLDLKLRSRKTVVSSRRKEMRYYINCFVRFVTDPINLECRYETKPSTTKKSVGFKKEGRTTDGSFRVSLSTE